jgi:hypothetical protein
MKIAIASEFGHMECLGFLLETLQNNEVTVYYADYTDRYNWVDYFKTLYTFTSVKNINIDIHQYDKIIKVTCSDNCLQNVKTISLLHLYEKKSINNISDKFISLTPYINGANIYYLFPIFKPVNTINLNSNIILFVGYYENRHFDEDTITFIQNNPEYQFIFVVWASDNYYSRVSNFHNVRILKSIGTSELIDYINKSKFMMSKKYINFDRFSGQISLAMSFEKPMFVDNKTAKSYNLPCFKFNSNYIEIGKIKNISNETYIDMVNEIKKFNTKTLTKNKLRMLEILE